MPSLDVHTAQINYFFRLTGLILASLIIVWSPFSGGARMPVLLLSLLGVGYALIGYHVIWQQTEVRRWTVVFLLLWMPMCISLFTSIRPQASAIAVAWFLLLYFAGITLTQVLKQARYRNLLAHVVVWTVIVWFVDSMVQYLTGTDLIGVARRADGRITGFFKDLHQGIILLPILPLACYMLIRQQKKWAAMSLLLMSAWMMTMSGSRGYLYILVLILACMVFQLRLGLKKSLLLLAVPLIAIAIAYPMSHSLISMKMAQTEQLVKPSTTTFDKLNGLLSYRLHLWETGMHMFAAYPVTGIGTSNFKAAYPDYATRADDPFVNAPTHTHNIYVELLAETGMIGLAGLVTIMLLFYRWYRAAAPTLRAEAWPFALPLMAIYFPLNTTQPMLVPWWFPLLMLIACGFIASLQPASTRQEQIDV